MTFAQKRENKIRHENRINKIKINIGYYKLLCM